MTTEALGKNLLSYLPQFFGGEVGAVTRNNVPLPPLPGPKQGVTHPFLLVVLPLFSGLLSHKTLQSQSYACIKNVEIKS